MAPSRYTRDKSLMRGPAAYSLVLRPKGEERLSFLYSSPIPGTTPEVSVMRGGQYTP